MMNRRQVLKGAGALLAMPALARAASATTLKFVPYADLALLDPLVSAFVTRNHAMMVFDTLFALDDAACRSRRCWRATRSRMTACSGR